LQIGITSDKTVKAIGISATVEFGAWRMQGGVGLEHFPDLRRRSGCGAKHFRVGADAESMK